MSIRIAIADDHPMMIQGLGTVLSKYPNLELVASYKDGAELLKGLENDVPDVLLLDIQMPGQTGDELAPIIVKTYPDLKILTLTNFDSTLYANNMLRHGVHGYVLKTAEEKILVQAIESVYKGEIYIDSVMKEKMEHLEQKIRTRVSSKSTLTMREKEILQLLVYGSTCPEIAEKLFLSVNTVMKYRASIMLKLDVNNTASLVMKVLRMGLVE